MEQLNPIVGKKVVLRDWSVNDVPLFKKWQTPGHRWQELDAPYYKSPNDESEKLADELLAKIKTNNFPNPRSRLVLAEKESNKLVGIVSSYWESKETNWLCAGIVLFDEQTWGNGFGSEALTMWIDYLFENHSEIVRLDLRTWSGNSGMIHLAKKLGFQEEARFRKARIVAGQYFDSLGFGILREEWGNKRA